MANPFNPGDLVVSVYGDGDAASGDTTTYTDNQAAPLTLQDISTSGVAGGQLVLPQTTTTNAAGVTEYAVSGEYGSSSEGSLQLSADGQSLVIAGYGVNAATYNAGESNGNNVYGNPALAQSTSLKSSTTATPIARVVADVNYAGTVDSSTALYNIYNTNNPRSVATANGSSFYLGGQGVKGDTTQGVFLAQDGASSATAINTTTDVRTVELYNNQLYVSQDSKQPATGGTSNISTVGTGQPTANNTTETPLPGISQNVALSNGNGNNVNGSTGTVNLSPENYYFANASTLYVADGGAPKQGGMGDGGLQKWSLNSNNVWQLDYTLSSGLNLQPATGSASSNFSTGLIGLTGKTNANGTVSLYATTEPDYDTNTSYLVGVTDTLSNTTAQQSGGETFKTLMTAAPDTVIRGVAFAPTCYVDGIRISTVRGEIEVEKLAVGDLVVTSSGAHRPIRWIGHRTVDCARHPQPEIVLPVRIAAHAFAPERPSRDLVVSPGHAVAVDLLGEVLIPAVALVNGATIRQDVVERVTYWHVELDSHDLLMAENLPAESYLDMGNRAFFGEGETVTLHGAPDVVPLTHDDFCRPFHGGGEIVAFVHDRLVARAAAIGWALVDDALADMHLVVDGKRIDPDVRGLSARFHVPADATSVWLVSQARVPARSGSGSDQRQLGVCIASIAIGDGFGPERTVISDDARLCVGFHAVEAGPQRWTAGRALLPTTLWDGCGGSVFLRVDLAHPALPRWEQIETACAIAANG